MLSESLRNAPGAKGRGYFPIERSWLPARSIAERVACQASPHLRKRKLALKWFAGNGLYKADGS